MPAPAGHASVCRLTTLLRATSVAAAVLLSADAAASIATDRYFTSSDGVRLHYQEAGSGPGTIVLVPGWTMPADIWRHQVEALSRNHRVVAFDPRGQGASDVAANGYTIQRRAADLRELLDAVAAPQAVVVAWSLGVLETLACLHFHGERGIAGLVLVDNSIGELPRPRADGSFLKRLRADRAATTDRFVRGMFRSEQPEAFKRHLVAQSLRMPTGAAVSLLSYPLPREFWKDVVHGTALPVLYVVTPRLEGQAGNLARGRPASRTAVFRDAGHALFVDEPDRFNALVEAFVTGLRAGREGSP